MKSKCTNEVSELIRWVQNKDAAMRMGMQNMHNPQETQYVTNLIMRVSKEIMDEYPFYSEMLKRISTGLFMPNGMVYGVNTAVLGELALIVMHIEAEPINTTVWRQIHPRVAKIAKALYVDGHYDSAAEKAIKEVEVRLREKFTELRPNDAVPSKVGDIIGALFSDGGVFQFCDTATTSGKDYRRGNKLMFEAAMAAYRNPAAHENLSCTKREAIEQITLASQLMYVLDKPNLAI